jgi:hypothetical protein
VKDYRTQGEDLWEIFNGGRDGTLWFYNAVHDALGFDGIADVVDELGRALIELNVLSQKFLQRPSSRAQRGICF